MIGYIYRIICLPTKKCYVGITKNYKKRMQKHIKELNNGTHHSPKLLNAWRYYGEENFEWVCRSVRIGSYDDLYQLEIEEIKKYDSFNNGYNCNSGGKISDWKQIVQNEDIVLFLCVSENYGDGYGKAFEEKFGWARGTASAAKTKERYFDAHCIYETLTPEERKEKAENFMKETDFLQIVYKRQLNQGGCEKAYLLTQEEYNFAFAAQELGFKYTPVAIYLGIKPNTAKDWFNGRAREQSRDIYRSLSENEKNEYKQKVQNAHLEAVGKDKFINKREEDVVSFLCYDQFYPQNDTAIQRLFQWSEGTCYGMRKPNRYPITKAKVALLSEEIKRDKADELQARLLSSGPIKIAE